MPSYYIEAQDKSSSISSIGYLTKCDVCGRKLHVSIGLFEVNHNTDPYVTCCECLEIRPEFEKDFPQIVKQIRDYTEGKLTEKNLIASDTREFTSNEILKSNDSRTIFDFKQTPVVAGTVTGTIYLNDELVRTFLVSSNGKVTFSEELRNDLRILAASIDHANGIMGISWEGKDELAEQMKVTVSYEYFRGTDADV